MRVWAGFIDYWLMALFVLTTDRLPKILLTTYFIFGVDLTIKPAKNIQTDFCEISEINWLKG